MYICRTGFGVCQLVRQGGIARFHRRARRGADEGVAWGKRHQRLATASYSRTFGVADARQSGETRQLLTALNCDTPRRRPDTDSATISFSATSPVRMAATSASATARPGVAGNRQGVGVRRWGGGLEQSLIYSGFRDIETVFLDLFLQFIRGRGGRGSGGVFSPRP